MPIRARNSYLDVLLSKHFFDHFIQLHYNNLNEHRTMTEGHRIPHGRVRPSPRLLLNGSLMLLLCARLQQCQAFIVAPAADGAGGASRRQRQHLSYAPFTQVISDVDDTLKSSGGVSVAGVALGGIDTQYARGIFCEI